MKRVIVCLLFLLAACKGEYPSIPHNVIPLKKMTGIVADIHIADAVATTRAQGGMDEKLLSREYYKQIFKNYDVTEEEYLKSYKFYESNPKLFNKMYDDVLGEISRQEDSISKKVR